MFSISTQALTLFYRAKSKDRTERKSIDKYGYVQQQHQLPM